MLAVAETRTPIRDYYAVLGLERDADGEAIKKAYRELAHRYHPDVSRAPEADDRFREIAEAYAVLSTPTSKLLYDLLGYRTRRFRDAASERESQRLVGELQIDEIEAERGSIRYVTYTRADECEDCGGTGVRTGVRERYCAVCGGEGMRKRSSQLTDREVLEFVRCDECSGTGIAPASGCEACNATGRIARSDTGLVDIPAGVQSGETFPVESQDREVGADGGQDQVLVRIRPLVPDLRIVRFAAVVGLLLAVALLIILLVG
jgi:molecular chaperone DnaJ